MQYNERKLKVGVIGLGKMGLLHASILSVLPSIEIVALCDKSKIVLNLAKKMLKKPFITDRIEKLNNLDIDLVYVTTPIPSHYSIIKQVYESITNNIFVEKTLSSNYAEAEELCLTAKKYGGNNIVGYMKRFSVTFKKAKELLEYGFIGSLKNFEAYALSSDFSDTENSLVSKGRGDVLHDLGSHIVDLAFWYFEDLLSQITVSKIISSTVGMKHFVIVGQKNFTGEFNISWCEKKYRMPEFNIKIYGSKGTIDVNDNFVKLTLDSKRPLIYYRQDLDDHVDFYLGDSEYFRENDQYIKSIFNGSKLEPSFQIAKKVDFLLDQVKVESNE